MRRLNYVPASPLSLPYPKADAVAAGGVSAMQESAVALSQSQQLAPHFLEALPCEVRDDYLEAFYRARRLRNRQGGSTASV